MPNDDPARNNNDLPEPAAKEHRADIWSATNTTPTAANDPLQRMIEIAKDPDLTAEDKATLIQFSRDRFKNRRFMAYISLWTIVVSVAFILIASVFDGLSTSNILEKISANQGLIGTIEGLLTTIVAAYYGVSTMRPSS